MLRAVNLIKSYQTEKKVKLDILRGVTLNFEPEKITIVIGASGAGKSTLLHILGGLDRPDSGEVMFHEKNIFALSDEKIAKFRNKNIGFIFQFHHLLPEFTAVENTAIPLMIGGVSLAKATAKAKEILEIVGLSERLHHKPAELSGGEQQRVAIARALANDPSTIFADEPTGNLDTANSESIHELIVELRDKYKKTMVIVTHNRLLMDLADKLYEIQDGRILPNPGEKVLEQ
jgi:lipoprotein-releasing system ATP-binding protein